MGGEVRAAEKGLAVGSSGGAGSRSGIYSRYPLADGVRLDGFQLLAQKRTEHDARHEVVVMGGKSNRSNLALQLRNWRENAIRWRILLGYTGCR